MSGNAVQAVKQAVPSVHVLEALALQGDLSKLTVDQRLQYYSAVCESLGLNPLTRPFEYIMLNGKLTLYAKRDCTDQLRRIHNVSISIVSREKLGDVYIVTAQATLPNGRKDESIGVVNLGNLKGDALANALMKAETKAKRRVTLSICGLSFPDETEVETIPGATFSPELATDASKPTDLPKAPEEIKRTAGGLTEKQIKRLFAIARSANWTNDEVKKLMEMQCKKTSTSELTRKEYDELINYIAEHPAKTEGEESQEGGLFPFEKDDLGIEG